MALDYDQQAAKKYSRAEREQLLPTISTIGVMGGTPVRDDQYFTSSWFGAVGVDLEVPIFSGFRYAAKRMKRTIGPKRRRRICAICATGLCAMFATRGCSAILPTRRSP